MTSIGGSVVRIYLPYVANVIEAVSKLSSIKAGDPRAMHLLTLFTAYNHVNEFLYKSLWADNLKVCKGPGLNLLNSIQALYSEDDASDSLELGETATLTQNTSAFRTVLEAEFQTSGIYLVTAKRGYDVVVLLESAETIFAPEVNEKLPGIKNDLREAGKCLAFNLGTAAAFHLLRALETAVCAYWAVAMGGAPLPTNRNLGRYITEMASGHHPERKKVIFALRQVKDLHRNSIMHPEETLGLDQAIALLNTVQSAITLMLPNVDGETGKRLMDESAAARESEYGLAEEALTKDAEVERERVKGRKTKQRIEVAA